MQTLAGEATLPKILLPPLLRAPWKASSYPFSWRTLIYNKANKWSKVLSPVKFYREKKIYQMYTFPSSAQTLCNSDWEANTHTTTSWQQCCWGPRQKLCYFNNDVLSIQKCIYYIEKWPFMVIFLYNLYIFGIHLKTVLYPKSCYNEQCYKEVCVYLKVQNPCVPSETFQLMFGTISWSNLGVYSFILHFFFFFFSVFI